MRIEDMVEILAEIEHEQWKRWARKIIREEKLSKGRLARWKKYFVFYSDLPEDIKEEDRYWARKILRALKPKFDELKRQEKDLRRDLRKTRKTLDEIRTRANVMHAFCGAYDRTAADIRKILAKT